MNDTGNLVSRIERLERANLRLRMGLAAMIAGCSLLFVLGAASKDYPKVLEAEEFVLRGKGGQIIASLSSDPVERDPQLALWSNDGRSLMTVSSRSISYSERDEEAVKINAAPRAKIILRFNDDNEFFDKVREPK